MLLTLGAEVASTYIEPCIETKITSTESTINTKFPLDHSQLPEMLLKAAGPDRDWQLAPLEEGWEWFAFTFHDQQPMSIPLTELEDIFAVSDEITKQAFSRASEASTGQPQPWARHQSVCTGASQKYATCSRIISSAMLSGPWSSTFCKSSATPKFSMKKRSIPIRSSQASLFIHEVKSQASILSPEEESELSV